jgi:hypothetical protein
LVEAEGFAEAPEKDDHVGLSGETTSDAQPDPEVRRFRIPNRKIITPRPRPTAAGFVKATSPELERQLQELIAGKIEELPRPPQGKQRIIIAAPGSAGERRFCMQLGDALTKFGYEWCICSDTVARMAGKMNPDFFISLWSTIPPPDPASGIVSLLYIHSPSCVSSEYYPHVSAYGNFLFAQSGTDELEEHLQESGKNFRHLKTYLTLGKTNFCSKPKKRLAYVGYLHDPRRKSELVELFQLLDKTDYCDFYGWARTWRKAGPNSWRGEIRLRGTRDVQDIMEAAGIALLLHHKQQFESGSPVYRDFEALSSSCVIITEKTAFMQENFSDCVLFIDMDKSAEEIFEQIDVYVKWIHEHPEEAVEMARKSHKIFCDKFSLEGECEKIINFIGKIPAPSADEGVSEP